MLDNHSQSSFSSGNGLEEALETWHGSSPYELPLTNQTKSAGSLAPAKELILIDSKVDDYSTLLNDFSTSADVFIINSDQNGIEQITDILTHYQDLDAVHVVSHGTAGALHLGNDVVDQDALTNYAGSVSAWGDAFSDTGDLLLYGCNVAEGDQGQQFVQQLGYISGTDVAASTDLTGNTVLGGNWSLEYALGDIEANTYNSFSYGSVLFDALSVKDNILVFQSILSNGADDSLTFSTSDGKLLVTHKALDTKNYQFNLSDIKKIDIDTGAGADSITFGQVDFGRLVDVNIKANTGGLLIDDDTVTFTNSGVLKTYGGNINIAADIIEVQQGYTLSTQKNGTGTQANSSIGDSGNLTLTGQKITVGGEANTDQAVILTDANAGFNAGDIKFEAAQDGNTLKLLGAAKIGLLDAEIDINNAELKGGDIDLLASVDNSDKFLADASRTTSALASPISFITDFNFIGGVAVTKTKATINLSQSSDISAQHFEARALTTSEAAVTPMSFALGVGVGIIDAHSEVIVEGDITATDGLILATKNENTLNVLSESDPVDGSFGMTAAVAVTSLDSLAKTQIAETAKLTVGSASSTADLTVQAETVSHNFTSASSAAPQEDNGSVAIAVAISEEDNETQALVDGNITVHGNLSVTADQTRQPTDVTSLGVPLNGVAAGAGVNSNSRTNLIADSESAATDALVDKLTSKLQSGGVEQKTKSQGSSIGAAGAVAYADLINNTTARIGEGAVVKSNGNVDIKSSVNSRPDISASSSVSKPEKPSKTKPAKETKFAGSAAVAFGSYTNNAEAYIGKDAVVDAKKDISVTSESLNEFEFALGVNLYKSLADGPTKDHSADATTPVRVQPGNIIGVPKSSNVIDGAVFEVFYEFQGSLSEELDLSKEDFTNSSRWKSLGTETDYKEDQFSKTLFTYLEGDAGLDNNVGDSFVQSTAESDKLAVAGGVTILELNQDSDAYIAAGAQINQDAVFLAGATDQTVTVNAKNINDAMNLIGNVQLPGINGDIKGVSPVSFGGPGLGTEGGKGSVGASILLVDYNNKTTAKVEKGVALNSDSLSVKADSQVFAGSIGVSGGSAGTFGANGTIIATDINNKTLAQIEDGVTLNIGSKKVADSDASLVVDASDRTTVINIAGGVLTSNNTGIGASISLNTLQREVEAIIGALDTGVDPSVATVIKSQGNIDVSANAEGDVFTLGLAAAIVNEKKTQDTASGGGSTADTSTQGQKAQDQGKQGSFGLAVSGDVSLNTTNDSTLAYINDAGTIQTSKDISVKADNDTSLIALSGSAAIVTKSKGNSAGLAGSVSINNFTGETKAYVKGGGTLKTNKLSLNADRRGNIFSLSAAAAATASRTSIALAGSVSLNDITNTTEAYLQGSKLTAFSDTKRVDLSIKAKDGSSIFAIGGSAAYGGKAGIGASIAINTINAQTNANVIDATIINAGSVSIDSINDSDIKAITASAGVSKTFGGAGTVSINKINSRTDASIRGTNGGSSNGAATPGDIADNATIKAKDTSEIHSLSGAVGIGKVGFGAAIAYNEIDSDAAAYVTGSSLEIGGELNLDADSERTIHTLSLGVAGGSKGGLAGSVSINYLSGTTKAYLADSTITATQLAQAKAITEDEISSLSGGFAGGGKGAVGAAVSVNNLDNNTKAYINNAKVTSSTESVIVDANLDSDINNLSVGGAGAGKFALGGAVSINNIDTSTEANIQNASNVTAQKDVKAIATDNAQIQSLAGGVAGAGTGAVGAAGATGNINNAVKASATDSTVTAKTGDITISADLTANVQNLTVGGAGAGQFALGGAVSVNNIKTKTEAIVDNGADLTAQNNVNVLAKDDASIQSIAGGVAGAGTGAAGAAVATNNVENQTKASVNDSKVTATTNQVNVEAKLTASVENITVGAAGAGTFSLGGGVSVNNIDTVTEAVVSNSQSSDNSKGVTAKQSVNILATDDATISSIAGGAAGAGTAAFGAAVATNNINNKTKAIVDKADITSEANQVQVKADLSAEVKNITAGGAGAGTFSLGGAVSVNNIKAATEATIRNGSNVKAKQDVQVLADNSTEIQSLAGQVSGAGGAAIGASLAVNNIGGNTSASIESGADVEAEGAIKVVADSTEKIKTASAGASVAGGVALTGSVATSNITGQLTAHTDDATLNAGSLEITAKNTGEIKSLAGQISIGIKGAGVGAAVAYNNIGNSVTAYAKDSTISTEQNAVILAQNAGIIETLAAGLSAGLFAGVGGSVAVNEMTQQTSAYVQGGRLSAQGSVGIFADSDNTIDSKGGTLAAGAGGVGGTVVVNHLDNDTKAYINDATVNSQGNQLIDIPTNAKGSNTETIQGLAVLATSNDSLDILVGTGAVGIGGLAATISVNTFTNRTQAYAKDSGINIDESNASANQSAYIKAFNNTEIDTKAGSVSAGAVAVGTTVDVTTLKNLTAAYVDNDENRGRVGTRKDLVIEANAEKTVDSIAVSGGIGLGALQGAVSVLNVGSALSAKGSEATDGTQKVVSDNLSALNDMGKDSSGNASIQTRSDTTAAWGDTSQEIEGTVAYLKGKAAVNGDIRITADETTTVDALSGAAAIGAIGAGGAVAIANVTHDVSAYVGDNSTLNVARESDININAVGVVEVEGQTFAGAAGAVGLGAAVTILDSNNNTNAYIGSGTKVTQARNINVTAGSSSEVDAEGIGAAIGAVAAGVVIANAKESGTTQAYVGNDVTIEGTNGLKVEAIVDEQVKAESQAAAGGAISASGSIPTATVSPNVSAYIGDRTSIDVNEDVVVQTNVEVDADAEAKGISIGAIAVGASVANINANPNIRTFIGADTTIEARNVTVESRLGEPLKTTDDSFDPQTTINDSSDTLSFKEDHGFRTGDTVFYLNGGGSSIGGLEHREAYSIIRVDDKTVKLGKEFNASEIDTRSNTIKFDGGHGFENGEEIVYEAPSNATIGGLVSGQSYYVVVIDGQTVKLSNQKVDSNYNPDIQGAGANSFKPAGNSTAIEIDKHGFSNGDALNYEQRTAQFTIVATLPDTDGEDNIFNLKGDIVSDNLINSASHGFETNDRVVYRTTGTVLGGLTNNETYYVIKENKNAFKLSKTQGGTAIDIASAAEGSLHEIESVGLSVLTQKQFSYKIDNQTNTIAASNHGFEDGQLVTYTTTNADEKALGGLTKQSQYYVIKINNNSFQLSKTKNGSVIDLSENDGTTHQISAVSTLESDVPYYVVGASTGSFKISNVKGGSALTLLTNNSGEGENHLFSKEQGGIVALTSAAAGTHNLHIDLSKAEATGGNHLLNKGAGITIPSQGDGTFSAHAQASSGGLIGGNATQANLNISPTVKTYVGDRTQVTATGDVTVNSLSGVKATGSTDSEVFGAIAVGSSKINATINNNNETYVGTDAVINATGDVTVEGKVSQTFDIYGSGGAGSLITFADADAHATVTYNNRTYIGAGAEITAQENVDVKSLSNTDAKVKAEANGYGIYADADSNASLKVRGTNQTDVEANAEIEGRKVTVEAVVETLKAESRADSDGAGLIGNIDGTSRVDLSGTKNVTQLKSGSKIKGDYVDLRSDYRGVNSRATAWANTDGLGGDTDAEAYNIMPLESKVSADATATITAHDLNVAADFSDVRRTTSAEHDKAWELRIWTPLGTITITMDFGDTHQEEKYDPAAYINFNANVNLLSREVNPVLVIDENGNVSQESEAGMVSVGQFVVVDDIINNSAGSVDFSTKGSKKGSFTDSQKYTLINPAYDTVQITNHSDKDLVINDIKTLNTGGTPNVSYANVNRSGKPSTPSLASNLASLLVNPTLVTINNLGDSDIVLKGVIDNASNRVVLYSAGDIRSEGSAQTIVARELSLEAEGSIGSASQRVAAQLNQGHSRALTDSSLSDKNRLDAAAEENIYLDLTAKRVAGSDDVVVNIEKMDALTGSVDILAQQSIDQNGQAIAAHYAFLDPRVKVGKNAIFDAGDSLNSVEARSDMLAADGYLDVVTGGNVNWTVLSGDLNLKQAVSKTDDVLLSVDGSRDVTLLTNAQVEAGGDVTIEASGNVHFDQSATITAQDTIALRGDLSANRRDTVVNWDGKATATQVVINGGSNDNEINIRRTEANTVTKVVTGRGDDVVNITGTDNTLTAIQGDIDVRGTSSGDQDTLNIDASGSTSGVTGKIAERAVEGFGMTGNLKYGEFESLNVELGEGDDEVALLSTGAKTSIDGKGGDDSFRVGGELDASGRLIAETVGGTYISARNISGTDHETTIKGGSGNDSFTVNRNAEALSIQGEEGNDTLNVNTPVSGSRLLANGNVNFVGGAGTDEVKVTTARDAAITKPSSNTIEVAGSRTISLDATTEVTPDLGNTGGNTGGPTTPTNPTTPSSSQALFTSLFGPRPQTPPPTTGSGTGSNSGGNNSGSGSSSTSSLNLFQSLFSRFRR